jgi:NAD(P)-dependent dehydrogenase (short-subunit alcohol dehydrogenase family)
MKIKDSVVLVTGANRGLGAAFATAALEGGARKVYAAARDPSGVALSGAQALRLDVTSASDIEAAARDCGDVTLLINNAGIARGVGLFGSDTDAALRAELETNLHGPLAMARAFAPVLASHGGGAIINVLSVLSWFSLPGVATYCVSKSAAWSMTNGLRHALVAQHTQVLAVHVGFMATDMTATLDAPKASPADVVREVFAGLEAERDEVCADELSRQVRASLSAQPGVYLRASA